MQSFRTCELATWFGTSRGRPGCGQKKVSVVLAFLGNQGMTRDILGLNPLARAKCQRFSMLFQDDHFCKLSIVELQ